MDKICLDILTFKNLICIHIFIKFTNYFILLLLITLELLDWLSNKNIIRFFNLLFKLLNLVSTSLCNWDSYMMYKPFNVSFYYFILMMFLNINCFDVMQTTK